MLTVFLPDISGLKKHCTEMLLEVVVGKFNKKKKKKQMKKQDNS